MSITETGWGNTISSLVLQLTAWLTDLSRIQQAQADTFYSITPVYTNSGTGWKQLFPSSGFRVTGMKFNNLNSLPISRMVISSAS